MRILLVDDNLELINMLEDNLEDLGVNCESCIDSLSALELSKTTDNINQAPVVLTSGDFQYSN